MSKETYAAQSGGLYAIRAQRERERKREREFIRNTVQSLKKAVCVCVCVCVDKARETPNTPSPTPTPTPTPTHAHTHTEEAWGMLVDDTDSKDTEMKTSVARKSPLTPVSLPSSAAAHCAHRETPGTKRCVCWGGCRGERGGGGVGGSY